MILAGGMGSTLRPESVDVYLFDNHLALNSTEVNRSRIACEFFGQLVLEIQSCNESAVKQTVMTWCVQHHLFAFLVSGSFCEGRVCPSVQSQSV